MTYVFYDIETTGTNTSYDQILQFAGVLTNDELRELDRFEIRCRLMPHIVPAPGALRATQVRPALLMDASLPSHYEAVCAITEKLREWSPATFIGYNSLDFDEVLLRQAFYQNLKPVYLTNTNRNTRADALRLVQAASVHAPDSIIVPVTEDGRPTRRLDAIAPANGFNQHNAHDALGDVEATIFMARLVKQHAPAIWDALMPLAAKPAVIQRALSGQVMSLTEFYKGKPYSWLVVGCGQNPEYDAQLGVFDLSYDPARYVDLPPQSLIKVMNSREKAIRSIRANNQPILCPRQFGGADFRKPDIDENEIERRVRVISQAREFQIRVGEALCNRYPRQEPAVHVEERIYDGFPSRTDQFLMEKFHQVPWESRGKIVDQLDDRRLRELGHRLIYLEKPDALSEARRSELDLWKSQRLNPNAEAPWLTVAAAMNEADKLLKEYPENRIFTEFIAWLRNLAEIQDASPSQKSILLDLLSNAFSLSEPASRTIQSHKVKNWISNKRRQCAAQMYLT
jgi:exodeoxyribonuclease-1